MNRYWSPQEVVPFTRALAAGVNVNFTGLDAALEAIQSEIDSGADIRLRSDLLSDDPSKGASLVHYDGGALKATLDKVAKPINLTAIGAITGNEALAAHDGTGLVKLSLSRLLYSSPTGQFTIGGNGGGSALNIGNGALDPVNYGRGLQITNANGRSQMAAFVRSGSNVVCLGYKGASAAFGFGAGQVDDVSFSPNFLCIDSSSGRIGINTTTPITTFEVNGGIHCANGILESKNLLLQGDDIHAYVRPNNAGGWLFLGGANLNYWAIQNDGHYRPVTDNVSSLCVSSARCTVVFSATGMINTSDEREKTWKGGPNAAYRRAAARIIEELGFYQWNDAVAEKGDDARWHFGARAQRVIRIFMDEELEAQFDLDLPADQFVPEDKRPSLKHAFLCFDTWEEQRRPVMAKRKVARYREVPVQTSVLGGDGRPMTRVRREPYTEEEEYDTGETEVAQAAGNRFGFRTDQLCMFLLAAALQPKGKRDG